MEEQDFAERDIFYAALDATDAAQRRALLDSRCEGDAALRQRIEKLLLAHDGNALHPPPESFFELGSADVDLEPGKTIGRFKLLEKIGEGGFGVVYMAAQLEPVQRRVALKIMKAGMDTKEVIGRFETERQALALMDHPNIAKVFDAGTTDTGRPYFVMELVRGTPVTEFCDQMRLPTEERLNLFLRICSAIQHSHQKGIIHRDIKPNNILVSTDGDQPLPKVIDFGIAKATQGRLTNKTLFTQFHQLMGTPAYMSPEQAQMTAVDVDTRSDIYSLGVLLYELLVGKTPFDSRELLEGGFEEMSRKIREVEPSKPSTRLSSLSADEKATTARLRRSQQVELEHTVRGELDWIVMKAIEKNRARRYESADALMADVQRFLSNEPVTAVAPTAMYRASKFIRRNKNAIVAATLFVLLLTLGTIVSTWQAIHAKRQTSRALAAEETASQNLKLANENLRLANENALVARRHQYAAEMMVAQSNTGEISSAGIYELLRKQIPGENEPDFRGFEWRRQWSQFQRELFSLEGHTDEIRDIAMSPDGRWLASGGTDGTARLWDVVGRRQLWSCSEGTLCSNVEFSNDSRMLLTHWWGGGDNSSILWDLTDPMGPTKLGEYESIGLLSPDGNTAISGEKTLKQWYLDTEEVLHEYSDPAFDGTEFAGQTHQAGQWTATLSADGSRLLTVGKDRTVKLWNTEDGSLVYKVKISTEIYDGAISPDGETIAAVSVDSGIVRLWNVQGNELHQIQVGNPLDRVRFSNDGKKLVVSERFGRIHVYDTETWDESVVFNSRGSLKALRLCSPVDPNIVVTASEINLTNTIRFWDISTKETVLDHAFPVRSVNFSHNGTMLAVGMVNGRVQVWDMATRSSLFETPETRQIDPNMREKPGITSYRPGFIEFSPDDRRIAVIGPRDTVTIWDLEKKQRAAVIRPPSERESFYSILFSPAGESLYAGMGNGPGVRRWDLSQPDKVVATLEQPGPWGVVLAHSSAENLLASGHLDVKLWEPPGQQAVRVLDMSTLPLQQRGTLSLKFSPSGRWLAGGTPSGNVWLWDTRSWTHEVLPMMSYVLTVDFSPDSQRIVAADMWSIVRMWDVESGQSVAGFRGSIAKFSPDGTYLAVGCEAHLGSLEMPEAGRVRLYYAPPLEELRAE